MEQLVSSHPEPQQRTIEYSPRLEFLLDNALEEAIRQNSECIGTEHMLLAMLRDADSVATRILATMNVDMGKVQDDILEAVGTSPKEYYEEGGEQNRGQNGMLEQFSTDLTQKASEGKLDPLIGREKEIERLM